jgi:hypothetical protein
MPRKKQKLLVSVPEGSRLLGISHKAMHILIRSGRLKARMVDGKLFVPREEVYRFARCEELQESIGGDLLDRVSEIVRILELKAGYPS